jgi:hypothetical protein
MAVSFSLMCIVGGRSRYGQQCNRMGKQAGRQSEDKQKTLEGHVVILHILFLSQSDGPTQILLSGAVHILGDAAY